MQGSNEEMELEKPEKPRRPTKAVVCFIAIFIQLNLPFLPKQQLASGTHNFESDLILIALVIITHQKVSSRDVLS